MKLARSLECIGKEAERAEGDKERQQNRRTMDISAVTATAMHGSAHKQRKFW